MHCSTCLFCPCSTLFHIYFQMKTPVYIWACLITSLNRLWFCRHQINHEGKLLFGKARRKQIIYFIFWGASGFHGACSHHQSFLGFFFHFLSAWPNFLQFEQNMLQRDRHISEKLQSPTFGISWDAQKRNDMFDIWKNNIRNDLVSFRSLMLPQWEETNF